VPTFEILGKQTYAQLYKEYSEWNSKGLHSTTSDEINTLTAAVKHKNLDALSMLSFPCKHLGNSKYLQFRILIALADCYFTTKQIRYLLIRFSGSPEEKCDVAVFSFSRIVDLRNFNVILQLFNPKDQANIVSRLGLLNIFNPLSPDGYVELDIGRQEERQLLKVLILIAVTEPGENFQNLTFCHSRLDKPVPGWELTKEWLCEEKLPTRGIVCLEFTSPRPLVKLRAILTHLVVLCEIDPDVQANFCNRDLEKNSLARWLHKVESNFDFSENKFLSSWNKTLYS